MKKHMLYTIFTILICQLCQPFVFTISANTYQYPTHPNLALIHGVELNDELTKYYRHEYYKNGEKLYLLDDIEVEQDIKEVHTSTKNKILINNTDGYKIKVPLQSEFDFSLGNFVKIKTGEYKITVSREWSPYEDVKQYIADYLHRYMLDTNFLNENNLNLYTNTFYTDKNYFNIQLVSISKRDSKNYNYSYAYVMTGGQQFYRIMVRSSSGADTEKMIGSVLDSFNLIKIRGEAHTKQEFKPQLPMNWSAETRQLYKALSARQKPMWGAYMPNNMHNGNIDGINRLEKKLDYKLGAVMEYVQLGDPFPLKGMESASRDGKLVELTLQTTGNYNQYFNCKNINFALHDGLMEEQVKSFARDAKKYGKPFLMRLDNEMNSDWVSYSAVAMLNDPELFVEIWRYIYNVFEKEGVNNAIWIFNPNDRNYPPCEYNHYLAYYPGNKYVQIIGLTGYNTGTYYSERYGEKWREFRDIYDPINAEYSKYFSEFPWVITEFASSSVGGNKGKWIENMFNDFYRYPNIKLAVWFNSADYDLDYGEKAVAARPYWLDENDDCVRAFRDGLEKFGYN